MATGFCGEQAVLHRMAETEADPKPKIGHTMTRTVVLDGHTLGVIFPQGRFHELQILRASVLRGSPIAGDPLAAMGTIPIDLNQPDRFREATEQDFTDFGVVFHPDYLTETPALGMC